MSPATKLFQPELCLPYPEVSPQTVEALEAQVLGLAEELYDESSWLHQNFYGACGVVPTELSQVNRPAGGHSIYIKNETEHYMDIDGQTYNAGTFKRRGAWLAALVAIRDNPELELFVTASAGNHALGVAFAARALDKEAHIYCRSDISSAKEEKLGELGAILHKNDRDDPNGDTLETAMAYAKDARDGVRFSHFIHPFDQVEVIAGQYTNGREMVASLRSWHEAGRINLGEDLIEIEAAVGGGGHAAGIAIAVKEAKADGLMGDNVTVRGARVKDGRDNTWCDGTATDLGELPQLVLGDKRYVTDTDTITNEELADAMFELTSVFNKMVEPAGSLSYALAKKRAATKGAPRMTGEKPTTFITTLTGANTARDIYGHFMEIRNAAYHKNLRTLGNLATASGWLPLAVPENKPRGRATLHVLK